MYSSESLVVFEGASNMVGQKSGGEAKQFNGIRLSIRPKCGGVVYAESKPQILSLFHEGEDVCNVTIKKRDPEDSEIYIRLEEYTKINESAQHSIDDKIDIYVGGELKYTEMLKATDTTMQEYSSEEDMMLSVQHAEAPHSAIIVYSTDEKNCGGEVRHQQGTIFAPTRRLDKPFDCGWTISNNPGNTVTVSIITHNLPSTPNCTDSYIEIRANNSSGKLLKRQCDAASIDSTIFEDQSLYVFLRYRPSDDDSDDDPEDVPQTNKVLFMAKYEKVAGGNPKNQYVSNPIIDGTELITWALDVTDQNAGILVQFSELYLLNPTSYLRFSKAGENDDVADTGYEEVSGVMIPAEKFFDTYIIRVYAKLEKTDKFSFTWNPVPLNYQNLTMAKAKAKKVYDCGGTLTPSYDWDYITNPLPAGQSFGYEENLHCRWVIQRPMFTGIELKFEYLDLENTENCAYDFITFRLQFDSMPDDDGDVDFTSVSKHCALARSNNTFMFSVNRALHIHFVTDRSRHGVGFKLKYRLSCNAFEHIRPGIAFETHLQSPNYNTNLAPREWRCQYSLIMESNRKLFVQILDLDIEEKSPCSSTDALYIDNRFTDPLSRSSLNMTQPAKYCGKLDTNEIANFTTTRGRLFIRYSSSPGTRKGFRLVIREVMTECPSGVLHLDENTPSRSLQSPEFPQRIPNSVECEYLMAAPNGHRVMLTFDADNFDIDGTSGECDQMDYVEVRDGPSPHSMLIGRFCGNRAPSSIYSTANFLYMKLHTSEYGKSRRFVAKYEIATCGGTIIVHENTTSHVTSPLFPDPFPSPIQCEWNIRSPSTHMLEAKVEHIWLLYNQNCSMEMLSVLDGNSTAKPLLGPACITRHVPDDYRAGRQYCNGKKCGFDLAVKLSDTKCGGTVTDIIGSLKPPGYPGQLLPHVRCVWDFQAKPGFTYRFRLNFTKAHGYRKIEPHMYFSVDKECFGDISIAEGIPPYKNSHQAQHFCKETKYYDTKTDISRVIYDDAITRDVITKLGGNAENETFYAPFTLDYVMVPATTSKGCTISVKDNGTFHFTGSKDKYGKLVESSFFFRFLCAYNIPMFFTILAFCHIRVEKPAKYGSVYLKFSNYSFTPEVDKETIMCLSWDAHVMIKSDEPVPIDKMICESTIRKNQSEMVYVNPDIDVWITQAFREQNPQEFNLTIEFQECGGVITTPNSGEITSPNFGPGQKYLPGSKCRWILEAPEGQIVKIKFVEMRITYEHECAEDSLIVGEGRQAEMNIIHKYCHRMDGEQETKLEERFKTLKSHGRYLSLLWSTNEKFEEAGWKLQYEFVNENDECGFHTKGMSGTIHTPNFGEKDYENNLECIWDVQVPLGYHVNLKYRDFDVETAANCANDRLIVSQEHSTRANSPNGDYYFLFQDEEKETPLCGIEHPKDFASESNRIRLNFTTDGKTTARGFRIDWEAACGTIYRLNHGVITSPSYPEGYPNDVMSCTYLIAPKDQNAVIALKFTEFDLSASKSQYGRSPCEEDHLQIIEASTDRVVMTLCGGQPMPTDALVFKGPIGLKFVTDKSFMWSADEAQLKRNRGFQLTYSMNKCGDNIELHEDSKLVTTITSPAFPLPYAKELDCVWNITTDSDRFLNVRFEKLDLEDFIDCTADFVELYDSPDMIGNKTMGKFCGTIKKAPQYRLLTSGPNLLIHMKTDFNVNAGGFKLIVTSTLGEKSGCGGRLTATTDWQTLTNPKDEDGNYPPALMCGWHISGPVDTQLRIRIDGVNTEKLNYPPGVKPKPECIDSLAIYDGQEYFSPLLAGDICSSETPIPKMLYTSHRHAFVTFETDRDGTGKGFNISYSLVANECGGWLRADSTMKALIYKGISQEENKEAGKERTHQRCRFMIQGLKTSPVIVNFNQFSIPSTEGDCSDSYVEIRDVGSIAECQHPACAQENHERRTIRMCGNSSQPPFISNTNTIQIIVSSPILPANKSKPVMILEYGLLDNCNRTINISKSPTGRLTSPNFPNQYSENATCVTKLETRGEKVMFVFKKFDLERKIYNECNGDYFIIEEKDDPKNKTYQKLCDTELPSTILSTGKDITTTLKTDHLLNSYGYDLSYYKVQRETDSSIEFSEIHETSGVVTNLGYPNGYNSSKSQIKFNIPSKAGDCSDSYVEIRDVGTLQECKHPACAREPNQRKITKLCGTQVPSYHISNTNFIQIIVSAEIMPAGNGTRPSFKFEYNLLDNCQRSIDTNTIKSGRLTSPNYPNIYSENSSCLTTLESKNQKILVAFSEFHLEDPNRVSNQCEYDYLQVHALIFHYPVLFCQISEPGNNGTKFCGFDLPSTFLTNGNDLNLIFKADHSLNDGGYDASYYTVISERDDRIQFAASYDLEGVVSNIGYPNGYNKSMSQVFTIRPPASHDCSFLFSDVNIGLIKNGEECTSLTEEYVEIEIFFKGQKRMARLRDCTFKDINSRELILEADTTERYVKFTFKSDSKSENDGRGVKIRWECHSIGRTYPILT
uniref:CUB domain-containing protein n=1 Tax=Caenorhabditis japonica TaxID=281687 RepID=A0A8R1DU11_CAEJA